MTSELLEYRDKRFCELLRREDLERMKSDAKAIEGELKQLGDEKKSVLQDSQRRLQRFLDVLQDK